MMNQIQLQHNNLNTLEYPQARPQERRTLDGESMQIPTAQLKAKQQRITFLEPHPLTYGSSNSYPPSHTAHSEKPHTAQPSA